MTPLSLVPLISFSHIGRKASLWSAVGSWNHFLMTSVEYTQFFGQQLPTSDLNSLQPVVSHQLCTLLLVSVSEMSVNLIIFAHRGGELTRISGTACSDCIYPGISKTARRQKQALPLAGVQPPAQTAAARGAPSRELREAPGHIRTLLGKGCTRQSPTMVMGTFGKSRKEINTVRNNE